MEGYCIGFSGFYRVHLVCGGREGENLFLGRFVVGDQVGSQFPGLFKIVTVKNLPISSFVGLPIPSLRTLTSIVTITFPVRKHEN